MRAEDATAVLAPDRIDVAASAPAPAPAVRGERRYADAEPSIGTTAKVVIGISAGGRPIVAFHRSGSATTTRRVLAVGVIHGDETAGLKVTDLLATIEIPADLDLWFVPVLNPDGVALGRTGNASGVDLNRNWPANWAPAGGPSTSGKHQPGQGPASEPETSAMMTFIDTIEPSATIWFHQPWGIVDCNVPRVGPSCSIYAGRVGVGLSFSPRTGTATDWIMSSGHGVSFVIEFGTTEPSAAVAARHAAAVIAWEGT